MTPYMIKLTPKSVFLMAWRATKPGIGFPICRVVNLNGRFVRKLTTLKQKTPVDVHRGCIYNDLIGRGKLQYYPCFCAVAFNASLATITISTRRFAARPASVSLSAIGSEKPLPMVTKRLAGTPCDTA